MYILAETLSELADFPKKRATPLGSYCQLKFCEPTQDGGASPVNAGEPDCALPARLRLVPLVTRKNTHLHASLASPGYAWLHSVTLCDELIRMEKWENQTQRSVTNRNHP